MKVEQRKVPAASSRKVALPKKVITKQREVPDASSRKVDLPKKVITKQQKVSAAPPRKVNTVQTAPVSKITKRKASAVVAPKKTLTKGSCTFKRPPFRF
jgi:hypothetical protein